MALPAVLFLRGNFRKLPLFTACAVLNLLQACFFLGLYALPQSQAAAFSELAWDSETVILFAQALAATEVLGATLKPYPGIWGLGWRALALTSSIMLVLVAIGARGSWDYAPWFDLNRGFHLTFATAIIACLLLIRYYSIPVPRAYKLLLGGFCFYSCTEILINTILQALFHRHFDNYGPLWQFTTMSSFVVAQAVWTTALWRPLPKLTKDKESPTATSPPRLLEVDERLRELNEKLKQFWRLEARPH
ncbi:MAG TPA: hypothetical protein VE077_20320 [Candidatus Methylomirabilis sp.]|nr:hypothetical protein [Candidatus Methylomirabilis sp.]